MAKSLVKIEEDRLVAQQNRQAGEQERVRVKVLRRYSPLAVPMRSRNSREKRR